jgi:ADP-ribosylglycohydrolase
MIGAIAGDMVGSTREFHSIKTTDFELLPAGSRFTDDSVLTLATAFSLMTDGDYAENYRLFGRLYPLAGYGGSFRQWLAQADPAPYNSWGNGSAMRISPVGFLLDDEAGVLAEAEKSAAVTHDHPEGIKGAQAVALGIFLSRKGADRETIKKELSGRFDYDLDRTCAEIRPDYRFDVSCQGSVPEAIICFLEAGDWEQAVRLAVSLGGDADTQACIAGGLAQALHGPPPVQVVTRARALLNDHLREILDDFETTLSRG